MTNRLDICDYHGCTNPIASDEEKAINNGMRFCSIHAKVVNDLIDKGVKGDGDAIKQLLSFWVKASGGPKEMVETPAGVYQSHKMARKR